MRKHLYPLQSRSVDYIIMAASYQSDPVHPLLKDPHDQLAAGCLMVADLPLRISLILAGSHQYKGNLLFFLKKRGSPVLHHGTTQYDAIYFMIGLPCVPGWSNGCLTLLQASHHNPVWKPPSQMPCILFWKKAYPPRLQSPGNHQSNIISLLLR